LKGEFHTSPIRYLSYFTTDLGQRTPPADLWGKQKIKQSARLHKAWWWHQMKYAGYEKSQSTGINCSRKGERLYHSHKAISWGRKQSNEPKTWSLHQRQLSNVLPFNKYANQRRTYIFPVKIDYCSSASVLWVNTTIWELKKTGLNLWAGFLV